MQESDVPKKNEETPVDPAANVQQEETDGKDMKSPNAENAGT